MKIEKKRGQGIWSVTGYLTFLIRSLLSGNTIVWQGTSAIHFPPEADMLFSILADRVVPLILLKAEEV